MQWFSDLLIFFFPVHCAVCGKQLVSTRSVLCLACEFQLPRTSYRDHPYNPISKLFWGRSPVEMGTALFRFEKGSGYQALLHDLKYRGSHKTGTYLGCLLGYDLRNTCFSSCDVLVPVPLHAKRRRERGYNQSEIIAEGVSRILQIPVLTRLLKRSGYHDTQTSMGRYERFENVKDQFLLTRDPPDMNGKRILLIDDVVTTGATLEACCLVLHHHFRCLVYVATVSCA